MNCAPVMKKYNIEDSFQPMKRASEIFQWDHDNIHNVHIRANNALISL